MRYHHRHIGMVKVPNTDNLKYWGRCKERGTKLHGWWEHKIVWPLLQTVWQFFINLNTACLYNLAMEFLGIYPNDLKSYVHTKTCAPCL